MNTQRTSTVVIVYPPASQPSLRLGSAKIACLIILIFTTLPAITHAVQPLPPTWPETPADVDTSGFALILGGGGARGIAHIGVLEVLEELGMRPSLIVGTSMGSVVGSLYASGVSLAALKELAVGQNLLDIFLNVESPPAQLQGGWWDPPPHQISLQIFRWPPLPNSGLSRGQGFESLIGQHTGDALFLADNDFDHLPIPFRCVSTDLLKTSLVIHDQGSLPRTVKASSTIPMIFYPVEFEGRQLVDGGFLDNLPVQVARRLGFKRAVLVDVSNVHLPDKEPPTDLYQMWIRMAELQTFFPNQYEVGDDDVLLKIPLANYRSMNMEAAPEILELGLETARRHRDQLLDLRDACGPVVADPPSMAPQIGPVTLKSIEIKGLQRMSPARALDRLQIHPGDRLDIASAWRKATWLSRGSSFQTISYEFIPVAADTADVIIHVQERTQARLELAGSVITDDGVAVMARLRHDNMFGRGGSQLLSYRYSNRDARLEALLDQSINGPGWLSLRAGFGWQRELPGLYDQGVEVDRYVMRRTRFSLDLALRSFKYDWSLYLGGDWGQTNSYLESRTIDGTGDQPLRTFHVSLESHGRDLPVAHHTRGARLKYSRSPRQAGDHPDWWRTDLGWVLPIEGLGAWRPTWAAGAVISSDDIPVVHQGRAGGPRGWIGLRRQEIIAPQVAWSRAALAYRMHGGIYLEIASAVGWYGQDELSAARPLWGGGIEAGMESLIGPLRLGFAIAERRPGYVYVQVGHGF